MSRHQNPLDLVCVEHQGPVIVETVGDGSSIVHFRVGGDIRDRERLLRSLRTAQEELWNLVPPGRARSNPEPPETVCRSCSEPLDRHVTRGSRTLECPNRCPGCNDVAVFTRREEDDLTRITWAMDLEEGGPPVEVYFCPFCGVDLRGVWLAGANPR
jgi:hypothetical protein